MDLNNSVKGDPILRLVLHLTEDRAFQDQVGLPSASSQLENEFAEENLRIPQTFKMNDLLQEIENVDCQGNTISSELRSEDDDDCQIMHVLSDSVNVAFPKRMEEFTELNEETLQSQKEFMEHENILEKLEGNVGEYEKVNETKKKKKVFCFDGVYIEDAYNVPSPDTNWSNSENFCLFVKNYERQRKNFFDLFDNKEFKFSENNPYKNIRYPLLEGLKKYYLKQDCLEAIFCFEAVVQQSENCITGWEHLINCLHYIGQTYDAIFLTKKCLHLDPNKFSRKLWDYLINEQYYYQGCQIMFDWLKNHKDYSDIIPRRFKMKDKTTNLINEKELKYLQNIFIKAAQRYPRNPDYNVQVVLSVLFELSREYSKASDCWMAATANTSKKWRIGKLQVGINLLRSNEPYKAIRILMELKATCSSPSEFQAQCENALALTFMYLRNYKKAGQYLLAAIDISKTVSYILLQKSWIQLSLCAKLMRRDDLHNLVIKRDFYELCKQFYCKSSK